MSSSTRMKIVLLAVFLGVVAVYGVAVLLSTTSDRVDQLDSDAVEDVAEAACTTLRTELDALPALAPDASTDERAARVSEQGAVVQRFLEQVRAVGDSALDDDVPAREWLGDWEALQGAREAFVAGGRVGVFEVPRDGEQPITMRMDDIGVDACRVPMGLITSP